jgi:SAM-dependent methyltransferase
VIEFTGERVVPGEVNIDLWAEHFARYAFAARYADGKRVLDLGCGTGYGAAELSNRAGYVVGVDQSPEALCYARSQYSPPNVRWVQASAVALPLADASFDLITAFEVIEHLDNWPALLSEARRVLAPNGLFLVSTPNQRYYAESRAETGPNPFHAHEFRYEAFCTGIRNTFPRATVLLQNRMEAFAFHAPDLVFRASDTRLDATRGTPDDAHFFLAVCPATELPKLSNYFYVPRAANVLREREQHVKLLEDERVLLRQRVDQLAADHASLQTSHDDLHHHLEQHNLWAQELEHNWKAAAARVAQLQDEFKGEQAASAAVAKGYAAKVSELEQENREKTAWAQETERRLSAELDAKSLELADAVRLLDRAEATVTERTEWARTLQARVEQLEAQLRMVRESRWIKLGRAAGVGPRVDR